MFKESFATIDMQYGISEEPNAVLTYSNLIQVSVTPSGTTKDCGLTKNMSTLGQVQTD